MHENLHVPLTEIREEAARLGYADPGLRVAIRTGDTPAAERAAMKKQSPDLLVTTPESLYLLLTAPSSRALLRGVRTVIVDEVHTLARDKRGSHLALSLERLDALVTESGGRLQRIGLSATQRPLDLVARLLSGVHDDRPPTVIVDCGHARDLDVAIELPSTELEAVMSGGQMSDILDRIAEHTRDHRTTLVFVNTRKMAERVAHQLAERLGENESADGNDVDASLLVAAHHGSLSAARRRIVETRLRAGDLRALVATASLELGIDVGPVELVCQIGSPRAIGTFLQRVGRANHHRDGTPAGRLYPTTRDELVECTALLAAVREGRLDLLEPPVAPLDVLTQQLVAEVASTEERDVEAMWAMTRRAAPYAELSRKDFDDVVALASWGIETGRGRRGAHLHLDAVNGRLRARRGARLAALTGGGAIPETGDYRVVLDPDGVTVGSVHEDFAVEATAGDIFLLGTHSWRVAKVEVGTVRVYDAGDLPPTIPFWLGEAPARTAELSEAVSDLRAALEPLLLAQDGDGARAARAGARRGVRRGGPAGRGLLRRRPGRARSPADPRADRRRALLRRQRGLAADHPRAVRRPHQPRARPGAAQALLRLVRLRAAGGGGRRHGGPVARAPAQLPAHQGAVHVEQRQGARGPDPGRAAPSHARRPLALEPQPRPRAAPHERRQAPAHPPAAHGGRRPAGRRVARLGRLPGERAARTGRCARPRAGPPDRPRLPARGALRRGAGRGVVPGRVGCHRGAHGRVVGALSLRPRHLERAALHLSRRRAARGAADPGAVACAAAWASSVPTGCPSRPSELAALDPDAVAVVLDQVRPRLRNADELHDLLLSLVAARPHREWAQWYDALAADGRAGLVDGCWVATERRAGGAGARPTTTRPPRPVWPATCSWPGPVTVEQLVADAALPSGAPMGAPLSPARARTALARLEGKGSAIELPDGRWCARNLLVRLHGASRSRRRGMVDAVPIAEYVRFLTHWQHATPDSRVEGRAGLLEVLEQLQGIEAPAAEWEAQILPARVAGYDARWLDELCLSGEIVWGRLTPRAERTGRSGTPSPATPLAFVRARRPRGHAARRCAPERRRRSPRSARRPTCSPRCGRAAPASDRSWRR